MAIVPPIRAVVGIIQGFLKPKAELRKPSDAVRLRLVAKISQYPSVFLLGSQDIRDMSFRFVGATVA